MLTIQLTPAEVETTLHELTAADRTPAMDKLASKLFKAWKAHVDQRTAEMSRRLQPPTRKPTLETMTEG